MSDSSVQLFHTRLQECPYLPGRLSRNLVLDPGFQPSVANYQQLSDLGYRRSGSILYRPDCPQCSACTACRVAVADFKPNRRMRRVWQRNQPLHTRDRQPDFHPEHYALFLKYLASRHPGGSMEQSTPEDYRQFIDTSWGSTRLQEFRHQGDLLAVAVMDCLPDGLSAIYTFFDPDHAHLSPGVRAVLWQISEAKRLGLPWVYLGYWIAGCRKMCYKRDYQPLQLFHNGQWHPDTPGE